MRKFSDLYTHTAFLHKPKNVNDAHRDEQDKAGLNTRLAVWLTKRVGTMPTAYSFAILAIVGLLAILGILPPLVALLVVWISQTFLQLVFLPILSVGQNVLGRHSELLAEEQYNTTLKSYHDVGQIIEHLTAQDAQLLQQTKILINLQRKALGVED